MANLVKLKRGSGSDPGASDMVVGEPVLRTDTAELFFKKDDGTVAKVAGSSNSVNFEYLELRNAANNGSASYPNANFTLVEAGTTSAVSPTAANTMLVSVNGVIQKPNTGTSTPSQGFAIDGSTIKFGANLTSAPNFILYQEAGGIGEPSNNTVSTNKIVDDAVTYAKIQNVSATDRILGRDSSGAGVIEEITPANLRTMLNVADGATNVTNNNQLTNGAGYITATLTEEQVEDFVGGMVSGNTETGITVTYQDSDGTLDFVVASQTDENFTTTLKNKLDGIAASATNVTNNNQLTNGAGYITATLTNEQVQDIVGAMLTGNTETGITVTYQDSDGTIDFVVGTLNQDTTGNAATATALETARTIGGTSFDGTANITPAECTNADTVDSLHATSFLRSDAADTATGLLSLNGGIAIQGKCSGNVTSVTQSSGNITFDFSASTHHKVTLTQNATFLEPSNQTVGQSGSIFIKQPSSGSYTGSFHSSFKFQGGTQPTLSTGSGMVDRVDYVIYESSKIHAVVTLDYQ